jgi:hypothetical protein
VAPSATPVDPPEELPLLPLPLPVPASPKQAAAAWSSHAVVSVHELQLNVCDPTVKYAPVHWLSPVRQSCRMPAPLGHVVPSAAVHVAVPAPADPDEDDELLQPPTEPAPPSTKATAATQTTRTFIPRS